MSATARPTTQLPSPRRRQSPFGAAIDVGSNGHRQPGSEREPTYRYGAVFLLMLTLVVFVVAAPSSTWSWAVAISIGAVALLVAGTTAGAPWAARPMVARLLAAISVIAIAATLSGLAPRYLTALYGALIAGAVPLVIARGLWRLVHARGVTLQAVAGALVIYLALGLAFAWLITIIAQISHAPYFAQHTSGTLGDRVYFSFTALTTTGFGDFSAGTPVGHALTVIEMLTGQLYLATVIGVLIGSYVGRGNHADSRPSAGSGHPQQPSAADRRG